MWLAASFLLAIIFFLYPKFCHFNYKFTDEGLVGFTLFGTQCAFRTEILGKVSKCYFFKYPFSLLLRTAYNANVSLTPHIWPLYPYLPPDISYTILTIWNSLLILLFWLGNFHYSVLQLPNPILCISDSTISSFECVFHLCYYILQAWLVLFSIFYLFVKVFSDFILLSSLLGIIMSTSLNCLTGRLMTYLCFIKVFLWGFCSLLCLHLGHTLPCLYFV